MGCVQTRQHYYRLRELNSDTRAARMRYSRNLVPALQCSGGGAIRITYHRQFENSKFRASGTEYAAFAAAAVAAAYDLHAYNKVLRSERR